MTSLTDASMLIPAPLFPIDETFSQIALRVCIGLLLLTLSGYVIALGHHSPRFARLFLTGAGTMLVIGCGLVVVS
jgi:VIT1/CCC1 family predicted Fe2+/Mn2+ transporter